MCEVQVLLKLKEVHPMVRKVKTLCLVQVRSKMMLMTMTRWILTVAAITEYASEWVESLNRDDLRSLSIFVWNLLLNVLEYQLLTDAAKVIAQVIGRCDRTVRQ